MLLCELKKNVNYLNNYQHVHEWESTNQLCKKQTSHQKTFSRGWNWDSSVVRGAVGWTLTSVACTNGPGCGYIHQMIK